MNIFKTRIVQIHLYICVNKLTNGIKPALIRNFNFLREKKDQPWIPKIGNRAIWQRARNPRYKLREKCCCVIR